jgi:hypothetical protein
MARLFGLFPREQALVLRSQDLRRDPGPALAAVRAFLGLPTGKAPDPRDVHVGAEMDYGGDLTAEDAEWLRRIYLRDQARLEALTGVRFG